MFQLLLFIISSFFVYTVESQSCTNGGVTDNCCVQGIVLTSNSMTYGANGYGYLCNGGNTVNGVNTPSQFTSIFKRLSNYKKWMNQHTVYGFDPFNSNFPSLTPPIIAAIGCDPTTTDCASINTVTQINSQTSLWFHTFDTIDGQAVGGPGNANNCDDVKIFNVCDIQYTNCIPPCCASQTQSYSWTPVPCDPFYFYYQNYDQTICRNDNINTCSTSDCAISTLNPTQSVKNTYPQVRLFRCGVSGSNWWKSFYLESLSFPLSASNALNRNLITFYQKYNQSINGILLSNQGCIIYNKPNLTFTEVPDASPLFKPLDCANFGGAPIEFPNLDYTCDPSKSLSCLILIHIVVAPLYVLLLEYILDTEILVLYKHQEDLFILNYHFQIVMV
jgi:hypothetical protein